MVKSKVESFIVGLTGAIIITALFIFNRNPINYSFSYNNYLIGNLIGLFWIPALIILLVFRSKLDRYGLNPVTNVSVWLIIAIMFVVMLAVLAIVSHRPEFRQYYPIIKRFPTDYGFIFNAGRHVNPITQPILFLYAWASYGLYLFCWEFFFRGYLLFGLSRSINWWAVIIQAVAFGFMHYGKPMGEFIGSFIAGIILGALAMGCKSCVPAFVLHWITSISMDILVSR